jgi:hydrogenase expression/formation protein HypC
MCLGVPGQIVSLTREGELVRLGRVSFGGADQEINLSCVPEAGPGDWVMVHAGIAIACIDEDVARNTLQLLADPP